MNNWSPDRLLPEYIKQFDPYTPSKPDPELMQMFGIKTLFRLNNNENPLGPPAESRQALIEFSPDKIAVYPSGDSFYLRQKLSFYHGGNPDQFLVGNGANEVISFIVKAFCESGDNIITADKTFAVYEWVATFSGLDARLVPLKDYRFDDQSMLERVDSRTKVIFVCNPNNPTGTYWDKDRLRKFLDSVDGRQVVVLDEAYFEFVEDDDYPNGINLINDYPFLVVMRTFSKMYGLAGLRIGYLAGNTEIVNAIRRTCIVYSVNSIAQAAAYAALGANDHIVRTRAMVKEGKEFLKIELEKLNLSFVSGAGNYMMIKLPMSDTLAYRKLMSQGIMVRSMTGFRFPNYIRLTVSTSDAMEAFVVALRKILN
jgi:histidinol-phosphate aminotransferase